MSRPSALKVTDAELAVLEALWSGGPSTIRELAAELYPKGGASAYATVQKLLGRLAGKGCVDRHSDGRAHVYRARIERGELIARQLEATAARLCDGALTPLLTHLVSAGRLSRAEIDELKTLVEGLDDGSDEEER